MTAKEKMIQPTVQKPEEPEIVTYDADELTVDVAFAGGSNNPSDRNLKEEFRPVDPQGLLKELTGGHAAPKDPSITTYDADELKVDVAFTGPGKSIGSDRNIKENFRQVEPGRILNSVASPDRQPSDPKITTYDADELKIDVAFAGYPIGASDRNIKDNVRPADSNRNLKGLAGVAKRPVEPGIVTYGADELNEDVAFTGNGHTTAPSDRNHKENFRPIDSSRILNSVASPDNKPSDPEITTFNTDELTTEVVFAGRSFFDSDRNLKENHGAVDPRRILKGLSQEGGQPRDPEITTFDTDELTTEVVFAGRTVSESDRNLKENLRPVDPSQTLKSMTSPDKGPADPHITSYDVEELSQDVVFIQVKTDFSDRNMKENFQPADTKGVLEGALRRGGRVRDPEITTYEADELNVDVAFTQGISLIEKSDRDLKEDFQGVDSKRTLDRVGRKRPTDPEIVSYDAQELTQDVVFVQVKSEISDRNLKENFAAVDSKRTLDRVGRKRLTDPEIVTYDAQELTQCVVFAGQSHVS